MSEVFVGTGNNKRADVVLTIFSTFQNMEVFLLIIFTLVSYNKNSLTVLFFNVYKKFEKRIRENTR